MTNTELATWKSVFRLTLRALPLPVKSKPVEAMTTAELSRVKQRGQLQLLAKSANALALGGDQSLLDHWRHAQAQYRHVIEEIDRTGTHCVVLKGPSLAALYPHGWVRTSGDLDLYAPTDGDLWRAADVLGAEGWQLVSGVLVAVDGGPGLVLNFERRYPECDRDLAVELRGVAFFGDPLRTPPRRTLPDSGPDGSVQIVPLLEEAFQRGFTIRDVFDAWLLTRTRSDALFAAVDDMALWPEYGRLVATAQRLGTPSLPAPPGLASRGQAIVRQRRRRLGSLLGKRSAWAYLAGRGLRRIRNERGQEMASQAVERLAAPESVYAAGLPVFGLRLDTTARSFALRSHKATFGADTPLGRFGFTHAPALVLTSDEVD